MHISEIREIFESQFDNRKIYLTLGEKEYTELDVLLLDEEHAFDLLMDYIDDNYVYCIENDEYFHRDVDYREDWED